MRWTFRFVWSILSGWLAGLVKSQSKRNMFTVQSTHMKQTQLHFVVRSNECDGLGQHKKCNEWHFQWETNLLPIATNNREKRQLSDQMAILMQFNCPYRSATFFCLHLFWTIDLKCVTNFILLSISLANWKFSCCHRGCCTLYRWCGTFHSLLFYSLDDDVWIDANSASYRCVATTDSVCHGHETKWNEIGEAVFLIQHIHIVPTRNGNESWKSSTREFLLAKFIVKAIWIKKQDERSAKRKDMD